MTQKNNIFTAINFNNIEKEIFVLKAIVEIIDSIVNHLVLKLITTPNGFTEVRFKDYIESSYFNIMLVDLISTPAKMLKINDNYIDYLYQSFDVANFDNNNSINNLKIAVSTFKNWLDTKIIVKKMWFPSISQELNFKVTRKDIIKICGNKCKHNFTRLTRIAKILQKIFENNNVELSDNQSFLIIDDFYNWFHGDGGIFFYYSSILTEMLNNIRHGIQNYLQIEFRNSYTINLTDDRKYSYKYPANLNNELAKTYYWDLMNDIRSGCILEKFTIPDYMKNHY